MVVVVGFVLIVGVPFAAAAMFMNLPIPRIAKGGIAIAPVVGLTLAVIGHTFWIGDPGGIVIAFIGTWGWLMGVGLSGGFRVMTARALRFARS